VKFVDRADAGRQLAKSLEHLRGESAVVFGIPRGGVAVAKEVAYQLGLPLDAVIVRKLGVPFQEELAFGAIAEGGVRNIDESIVRSAGVSETEIADIELREGRELRRREHHIRSLHPALPLAGRSVVVVDDGIATGSTARAACEVARLRGVAHVILAVPVAPAEWATNFREVADECVCVREPLHFMGVGQFYDTFDQLTDDDVDELLAAQVT
jgi:putative phosphoribosyl transferase